MTFKQLKNTTISYKGEDYRVWDVDINGKIVKFGELALDEAICPDGDYPDDEAQRIDETIGYFVEDYDEVCEAVKNYLDVSNS